MAKVMLATGLIVAYGYFVEFFMAFYSGNKFDVFLANQRLHGPYSHFYYALILCNILTPQLLWFREGAAEHCGAVHYVADHQYRNVAGAVRDRGDFADARLHAIGLGPLFRDVLGLRTFVGTLGLFTMLIFLFVRGLPAIAISEMRELVHQESHAEGGHE